MSGNVIEQNSQNFCQGLDKSPVPDNKNVGFHFTYGCVDENDTRCNHGSAADTKLGPALKTKNNRAPSSACGCMRPRGNLTQPTTTNEGYIKPRKKLRLPTGATSVLIGGGVGFGKVLVWHHIEWCSSRDVLQRWVAPALKKQFHGRKRCCILEDNDPTGNYSGRGLKAKEDETCSSVHCQKILGFECPRFRHLERGREQDAHDL